MATGKKLRNYSTIEYLLKLRDKIRPQFTFEADSVEEWEKWRTELKKKLKEIFAISGDECPLDIETLERVDRERYIQEKVVFDVEEGMSTPAYVLIPKEGEKPFKVVLCLHGHGYGKDDVLGITHNDPDRTNWVYRNRYDYAVQFVKRGYLVVAPEARGFGERAEEGGCRKAMLYATMMGKDITGMRIWDEMRTIDYIQSRDDTDHEKIGCVGLSMGGWHTSILAALDDRIKVALIAGFFNTFKRAILDNHLHCSCHFPTGLYKYAELPDIVSLIAPRPLLITSGSKDYFPIQGAKEGFGRVKKVYDLLGASDKVDIDIFEGGHEFSDRKAFDWFRKWLV